MANIQHKNKTKLLKYNFIASESKQRSEFSSFRFRFPFFYIETLSNGLGKAY